MYLITLLNIIFISHVLSFSQHPILIVISFDGFRYDYFQRNFTPHLSTLKAEGTTADYLHNVFPTKTFPNHHSIATGFYPEVHGVVGNSFFDPNLNEVITIQSGGVMFNSTPNVTPIWILNEKAGNGRYSGTMMWPGGTYEYTGVKSTYSQIWNETIPWFDRIDTVISWITDKDKPANVVMLYFEEPDTYSHIFGPNIPIINQMLADLDNATKYLRDKITEKGLSDKVNFIFLSDHGMTAVRPPQFINITKVLMPNTYKIADTSPCLHIIPKKGFMEATYQQLKEFSITNKHFRVFKKAELLPKWHYKNNPRIPPIYVLADVNYAFQDMEYFINELKNKYNITATDKTEFGVHGYDNDEPTMRPIFIAYGPNIKTKHKVPPFSFLDLYSLFCTLLDLPVIENNGTYANIRDIIVPFPSPKPTFLAMTAFISAISLIGCIVVIWTYKNRRNYPNNLELFMKQNSEDIIESEQLLKHDF